ncbi:hypothetical protein [Streptomyces sp. SID3343]|uniref:hypothetical protein n=1 Tax=Streptomyces sp. SID3343 TaxID=2690260 RepID=UPI00136D5CF3|nr:hypothetical protein [Streptomyces sp. SID3343]
MLPDDPQYFRALVQGDHIVAKAPGDAVGPAARIARCIGPTIKITEIVVAHDGGAEALGCAELFARAAVHAGFATRQGHLWHKPVVYDVGAGSVDYALFCARTLDATLAVFTQRADGHVELRLYEPNGKAITEDNGLAAVRDRLASGRTPQPVNSAHVGERVVRHDLHVPHRHHTGQPPTLP